MKFAEITGWVEDHPTESIVIGAGGVLVVLWLLGAFSSSSGSSNAGASNLASAYYAAEAQQAVVGGQIQMATVQAAAATAQNAAQVNGAVAINKAQAKAAITINGQNASAATTINGQDDALGATQSSNQLLATYSNNSTALQTANSNNYYAYQTSKSANDTSVLNNFIGNILPAELYYGHGTAGGTLPGGLGSFGLSTGVGAVSTPSGAAAAGYSPASIASMFG